MFRLVKVLNGNNQCEIQQLSNNSSVATNLGCALLCTNGNVATPTANVAPDYISMGAPISSKSKKINAMLVTEEMVFKVEFTGTTKPAVGMAVGLSTKEHKMDSVTYNANGKGNIIGIDDDSKLVYVRFRK